MYFYCHAQVATLQAAHMLHRRMKLNEYCSPWEEIIIVTLFRLSVTDVCLFIHVFFVVYFSTVLYPFVQSCKREYFIGK